MATDQQTQPYGEVFDRGYQHYDGPRLGRGYAIRRLIIYSIRRGLGIKGKWTAKLTPFFLYSAAYLPALVIIAMLAFLPDEIGNIGFDTLYGLLTFIVLAYAAALAPEMLCDDRRENTLPLYFSRPLSRLDYLVAKVSAMGILMATVIFGPPLLLFIGITLTADSPASYFANNISDLLKLTVYGFVVSAVWAAGALSVSLFTVRKGIAAAIVMIGVILGTGMANGFYETINSDRWRGWFIFLSPFDFIDALRYWIFVQDPHPMVATSDIPEPLLGVWVIVIVGIALYLMRRVYLRET